MRMDEQKSSKLEPRPQSRSISVLGDHEKMGRRKKDFVRADETEATKGNDLKNNDTWIRAAKDQKIWREKPKKSSQKDRKPKRTQP